MLLIHATRLASNVTCFSLAFLIEYIPVFLAKTNRTTTTILAWEKDSLVFANVYTGKEWNKATHNGLTLKFASRPDMVLSRESKLKDGSWSLSANDVINSKFKMAPWDLLKACILEDALSVKMDDASIAVFILRMHHPSGRTWANIL